MNIKNYILIPLILTTLFPIKSLAFDLANQTIKKMSNDLSSFQLLMDCPNVNTTFENIINKGKTNIYLKKGFNHCNVIFINEITIQCKLQEEDLIAIYNEKKRNFIAAKNKIENLKPITSDDYSFEVFNSILNNKDKCIFKKPNKIFLSESKDSRFYMAKKYVNKRAVFDNNLYECKQSESIIYNPLFDINEHLKIQPINDNLCSYQIKTENNEINCLFNLKENGLSSFVAQHINSYMNVEESINNNTIPFSNTNYHIIDEIYKGNCKFKKSI